MISIYGFQLGIIPLVAIAWLEIFTKEESFDDRSID